jgi:hypothetical protein
LPTLLIIFIAIAQTDEGVGCCATANRCWWSWRRSASRVLGVAIGGVLGSRVLHPCMGKPRDGQDLEADAARIHHLGSDPAAASPVTGSPMGSRDRKAIPDAGASRPATVAPSSTRCG